MARNKIRAIPGQPARRADERDAAIGRALRARRLELELSQTDLAEKIGVTFQQIQKYEKGTNRMGGGRIQRACDALRVPASYFFAEDDRFSESALMIELSQDRGAIELLQSYNSIPKGKKRHALVTLAKQYAA